MESVLGENFRIPLILMSNRKIWIAEKNQRIIEFSFAYMLNPHLIMNKDFKDQVKTCLSNTFGADTNKHINRYTRVLALVVFYELGNINPRKMFKVMSCVIYTIIDRYVSIVYITQLNTLNIFLGLKVPCS